MGTVKSPREKAFRTMELSYLFRHPHTQQRGLPTEVWSLRATVLSLRIM